MRMWLLGALAAVLLASCDAAPGIVLLEDPSPWPAQPSNIAQAVGAVAIVTNNYDDTLSYVDLGLNPPREIARLPVGLVPVEREGPHHLSLSPTENVLWVGISNFLPSSGSGPHGAHGTGEQPGYAQAFALPEHKEVARVRVDRNPGDIRVTPDGRYVAVTHFDLLRVTTALPGAPEESLSSRLVLIDTQTHERAAQIPVCPAAHGIVFKEDGTEALIACWNDRVARVKLQAPFEVQTTVVMAIPGTLALPSCQPYAMTPSQDGSFVWVGCYESGELRAYDWATGQMDASKTKSLGGAVLFGTVLEDARVVLPTQDKDQLVFLEPNGEIQKQVVLNPEECWLPHAVIQEGERLVVVCEGDKVNPGTLLLTDLEGETQHVVTLGRFPDDLAILPKGQP